MKQEMLFNSSL